MSKKSEINVVNKYTGEVMTYSIATDNDTAMAYAAINETIKALERAKDKLRDKVMTQMEGETLEVGKQFIWRRVVRNYRNYDPSVMRRVLDEDTFQLFVKPDKTKLDTAIKESIADPLSPVLPLEAVKELRGTMVEERMPVVSLRLERYDEPAKKQ